MFFRHIEDFESKFKFLDRINFIIFNTWRDKNTEKFRNSDMAQLESFYRTYISEMRELSNELVNLQAQIEAEMSDVRSELNGISKIKNNPEIEGCWICCAHGEESEDGQIVGDQLFVARYHELGNLEDLALTRTKLYSVKSAHVVRQI